jgi:NADH-quinone oxidoreductase subunit G
VDTKGREVMRILPRNHDGVNEEWISDKTRFVWDGLKRQRLDTPYIRENGKLRKAEWPEALAAAAAAMKGKKLGGLIGDLTSVEAAYALKALVEGQGGQVECRTDGAKLPAGNRSGYVGTATVEDLDNAQAIMLIGANPAVEAPVLNARIRKAWTKGCGIGVIGPKVDLTYETMHISEDPAMMTELMTRDHAEVGEKSSVIVIGQAALARADGEAILAEAMALAESTKSTFMVLHTAAGRVGAMDIGATAENGITDILASEVIYNLGADEGDIPAGPFVIYQGSHGDRGAHRADIILPAAAYTEETGLFVNTEGRPQVAQRASFAPGQAKENWAILRALSAELDATLPFDSIAALRKALMEEVPHLGDVDQVAANEWQPLTRGKVGSAPFGAAVADFYLSNPIARASELMAELSAGAAARRAAPLAAE